MEQPCNAAWISVADTVCRQGLVVEDSFMGVVLRQQKQSMVDIIMPGTGEPVDATLPQIASDRLLGVAKNIPDCILGDIEGLHGSTAFGTLETWH